MTHDLTAKRLSKIASEFNVGITTIVEFLGKKGITIDTNPNSKVNSEHYELLKKEYSSDIHIKKESEKLMLRKIKEKKESVSIEDIKETNEEEDVELDDVIHIKDVSSGTKKNNVPEFRKKEEEKREPEIKILGKIDLNFFNNKNKQVQKHEEIVEPVIEHESKETNIESHIHKNETPVEQHKEIVVEEKKHHKELVKEEIEQEVVIEKTTHHITEESNILEDVINDSQNSEVEIDNHVNEIQNNFEDNNNSELYVIVDDPLVDAPRKENEVKVVGRIDLDALNQKTRPAKKTRQQREDERKEKDKQRRDSIEKEREKRRVQVKLEEDIQNKKNIENGIAPVVHTTRVEKLTGPTVVGKIQLPGTNTGGDRKKTDNNFNKNKRKRKRITKEPVSVNNGDKTQPQTQNTPNTNPQNQANKPPYGGGGGQNKKKPPVNNRKPPVRVIKKEVNDEDVQKQIRETLAKLTTKGKSKGSKYRREKRDEVSRKFQEEVEKKELDKKILKVTEFVSANELANMMSLPVNQIISTCMELGSPVSINQRLDAETISIVAGEFGYEIEFISVDIQEAIEEEVDDPKDLVHRAPIVTVMGHVDHGKTSLLDYIRSTNVIAGEAGGITQHIGAYNVTLKDGKKITFLDTPGHEAFTAMRARGAKITDIAIIVISADDNVMPQTIEAINHAQAAGVPIVFAINKIDKAGANPERIKEELSKMNILVEEWGGKYQSQDISAKKGLNVDTLLDKVLLEAEMLDLKANPNKLALGSIIESELDKGRGFMATMLIQNGAMRVGDVLLAGSTYGRIKAMYNERNQRVTYAGPAEPVVVLGLNGAPQAGDKFNVMANDKEAKEIANKREQLQRELGRRAQKHITLDEIGRRIAIGNFKELNIIVKGDVDGSIEALSDALIRLSTEEIQLNIIHKAVGQISESDVMLAAASNAVIVGFQVRPSLAARRLAEREGIEIRLYSIIYDAINEIKDAMEGMLSPEIKEDIIGTVEIREVFKIGKIGAVGGSFVKDGKIFKTSKVRVIRDGIVIYTGELASLKRFKDDAKEVLRGQDCGLSVAKFNDIKAGDIVEAFTETEVKKTL